MTDWGAIQVRGARENNLRDVSLDIPKRKLTVFTGVSGSGKSSLVFETIAAESQRLINETYSSFVQGFMPTLARPDVDQLEGLTTAIRDERPMPDVDPGPSIGSSRPPTCRQIGKHDHVSTNSHFPRRGAPRRRGGV